MGIPARPCVAILACLFPFKQQCPNYRFKQAADFIVARSVSEGFDIKNASNSIPHSRFGLRKHIQSTACKARQSPSIVIQPPYWGKDCCFGSHSRLRLNRKRLPGRKSRGRIFRLMRTWELVFSDSSPILSFRKLPFDKTGVNLRYYVRRVCDLDIRHQK